MLGGLLKSMFGTVNDRILGRMQPQVDAINALEIELEALDQVALSARTAWLRERLEAGETLDDILVDAFATVREAAKRTLGQRHYDVQLLGGMVLHQGKISEMKTGEGKTLVSTLAVYLNALEGKGVHVVTVNDYLAKRDSEWMGQIYCFLGMTVGCIVQGLDDAERQAEYAADITYGTNNEFGFDYLRDNMKFHLEEMVQRDFNFAIVDEVDSILIDEARTPLIISGPTDDFADEYRKVDALIPQLTKEHYKKDEKQRTVNLTEEGQERIENLLAESGMLSEGNLYDLQNISLVHHANQALRAHTLFQRDTDYIVNENKVIIIDEFTGRMMEGRRYSDGLHQALEAKEKVEVQQENQTLASITFQNYFRLYPKLAGMTGTAMTEAGEFAEIYSLEVLEIPTNRDMIRADMDDEVYRTTLEKYQAILEQIQECLAREQPVLVGTVSIEKSEELAAFLKKAKIEHSILNARHHEQEAFIIADAGMPGAVTIATNMAGRGTDIQLGGNLEMRLAKEVGTMVIEEADPAKLEAIKIDIEANRQIVLQAGGLFVLGTERHESRRIDNQLRGRAGRQGDPGASKFFVSLEDDLMRIFGSERMDGMLRKLGLEDGEAIIHPWINKALAKAQEKVEERNFEIRKQLLRFDDVMNDQRKVIFEQRKELMRSVDVSATIIEMRHDLIEDLVNQHIPESAMPEQWTLDGLQDDCKRMFAMELPINDWAAEEGIAEQEICSRVCDALDTKMAEKSANYGPDMMRVAEKSLLLQILDQNWKDHLLQLDHLRQGIGLRAYGQRDPLNEYKKEAFEIFEDLLSRIRETVTTMLADIAIRTEMPMMEVKSENHPQMMESREEHYLQAGTAGSSIEPSTSPIRNRQSSATVDPEDPDTWGKVARNALCPCGSGKKYKHCHGRSQ
ncbi:preprotein translocase subunit SecA [Alphaproteobacteria bacterium]|jgi:preprotein translocase subunit SecA|nr:preprotein translocase subunit SecA [Alphaproteobacteria bacterium]